MMTTHGLNKLIESLKRNYSVEKLNLSNNDFEGKGFDTIIGLLSLNGTINSLSLRQCGIDRWSSLGEGLLKNRGV